MPRRACRGSDPTHHFILPTDLLNLASLFQRRHTADCFVFFAAMEVRSLLGTSDDHSSIALAAVGLFTLFQLGLSDISDGSEQI
jgi:hypothetical protein